MGVLMVREFTVLLVIVTVILFIGSTTCHPMGAFWNRLQPSSSSSTTSENKVRLPMSVSAVKSFGDVKSFLRSWFQRLRSRLPVQYPQSRDKRQADDNTPQTTVHSKENNESSFEDYERAFLLQQTYKYLKQIYYYSKYEESLKNSSSGVGGTGVPPPVDSGNGTRYDSRVLQEKMQELLAMSNSQLDEIFHNVRRAAVDGNVGHDITNLCCLNG